MKENSLRIELSYQSKGIISNARTTETTWLLIESGDKPEQVIEWRKPEFIKAVKAAMNMFSKDKYYDVDITLYYSPDYYNEKRIALIHRSAKDKDNDTYSFYTYETSTADIKTMSKAAVLKAINSMIDAHIELYTQELTA